MGKKVKLISFDETGKFEGREEQARFIGGIVYKGEDYLEEEKKLIDLFKKIACNFNRKYEKEIGLKIKFPNNFHMSNVLNLNEEEREKIKGKTKKEKEKIKKKIKNYIVKETIEYLESNGNYDLFMFAAPNTDSIKNEENEITKSNNLSDLEEPGNLYERLAILTVYNFVFYSLDKETEKNIFKLPTRTLNTLGDKANQKFDDNGNGYSVNTNKSTFKVAISTKIYEGNAVNSLAIKNLDLNAESINYKDEESGISSSFLYLSDIVCLYLQQQLTQINGETFNINSSVIKQLKENINLDIIIWVYDEIDRTWKKSIEAYADNNIAKTYSYLYDICTDKNEYGKYYKKYWVPKLEKIIFEDYVEKDDKIESFQENIFKDIAEIEYCMRNKNDYAKGEYIAKELKKIINSYLDRGDVKNINIKILKESLCKLYDVLLRSSNHKSSVKDSEKYLKEIVKLKDFIPFEEYIEIVNRSIQIYFNSCDFDKIIELYSLILPGVEKIKEAYETQTDDIDDILKILTDKKEYDSSDIKNINDKKQVKFELLGKMYSTLGQAYAFKQDYENSKKYFELALDEFEKDSKNYHQTLGYLMHLFISENKFEEYIHYSNEFYKSKNILEQMELLIKNDIEKNRYDFFIWIKALYKFFDSEGALNCLNLVSNELIGTNYREHPWQLIYKYMYLNCKKFNLEKEYQKYLKKAISNQGDIGLIKLIKLKTEYVFKCKNSQADKLVDNIVQTIRENELHIEDNLDKDTVKDYLDKYLVYMYD